MIPVRRAGNRPNLFMGGDRELVMLSGLLAFTMIFAVYKLIAVFYGMVLWIFALYFLRKMAKSDPYMRQVYLRHRRYKEYYPPRSMPFRVNLREYR